MDKIKNKLTPKTITIIAVSVLIVITTIIAVLLLNGGSNSSDEVKSLFIKNEKDMYAIYTVDGDKITDYDFADCNEFINGAAIVSNKKGEKGIVSSTGDMVVDFGEYDYIFRYGPLYTVSAYNENKSVNLIINSKGETIQENENIEIIDGIILGDDNEYKVVDVNGKTITSFKNAGEDIDEPEIEASYGYVVISYNGKVYLIDYDNSKDILSFENKGIYTIHDINPNNKEQLILLNTHKFYEKADEENFIIVDEGNLTYESKGKYSKINFDHNGNILAYSNKSITREFLDVNGKVIFKHDATADVIYSSPLECIMEERVNFENYVRFYDNGKLVKSIKDASVNKMGFSYLNLYPVYSFETRGYQYYDSEGNLIIKDLYSRASGFSENGIAIVTDFEDKTFLINEEGKRIGKKYDSLFTPVDKNKYEIYSKSYYKASLNDVYYILDYEGKVVVKGKYDDVNLKTVNGKEYFIFKKGDKYGVYDLQKNNVLVTCEYYLELEEDYIVAYTSDGDDYYSYGGKKIGE